MRQRRQRRELRQRPLLRRRRDLLRDARLPGGERSLRRLRLRRGGRCLPRMQRRRRLRRRSLLQRRRDLQRRLLRRGQRSLPGSELRRRRRCLLQPERSAGRGLRRRPRRSGLRVGGQRVRLAGAPRRPRHRRSRAQPAEHDRRLHRRYLGHLPQRRVERPPGRQDARRYGHDRGRHRPGRRHGLRLVDGNVGPPRALLRGRRQQSGLDADHDDRPDRGRCPDPVGPVHPAGR